MYVVRVIRKGLNAEKVLPSSLSEKSSHPVYTSRNRRRGPLTLTLTTTMLVELSLISPSIALKSGLNPEA